jgi:N6-L-threonylcarbamoyladenine synthase
VGVNHIRGHLLAVFLRPGFGGEDGAYGPPPFPFVALVVSGGHTSLFQVSGPSDIILLGRTRDDAAGEALDKGAKVLGLGYPGGPEIEKCADLCAARPGVRFPRGLASSKSLDFSFSGVKTALANHVRASGIVADGEGINGLCLAYQDAIVDVLVKKALAACSRRGIAALVVAGGVASNAALRREIQIRARGAGVNVHIPARQFCTDNAAMIAYAGLDKLSRGINETGSLRAFPTLGISDL